MSRTRLLIKNNLCAGAELQINAEQTRYIGRVLRLRVGDGLVVFNGENGEWTATIASMNKNSAVLRVGEKRDVATESRLRVHLVQGISRGERMDFVIQKATELGVKRVTPVLTEYGVTKFDEKRAENRRKHWQGVAESACEQSGRIRPPLIDAPLPLNTWFGQKTSTDSTQLILRLGAGLELSSISPPNTKVCVLIGPEGGFSEREYDDAGAAAFTAVSVGPRILRTETAAVAALAIVQGYWGDMSP
jgi:16S rRNA (uracil1498-N3)-methyltransferase